MTQSTITAKDLILDDVFGSNYLFNIPAYQRPYSWQVEHAEELFNDLWEAASSAASEDTAPPYFLGSLVLTPNEKSGIHDVVDGQQRLTTLTILFCALRDLMKADGESGESILPYIVKAKSKFSPGEGEYRVRQRKLDRDFFEIHILKGQNLPDKLSDPQTNMVKNREKLTEKLKELSSNQKDSLFEYIFRKCTLVIVEASDRASAYRVFSVMNNRGLDLSVTDILKADIIGTIKSKKSQDQYNRMWEEIEESLGRDNFSDLFSHIRQIFKRRKQERALIDELSPYFNKSEKSYIAPEDFMNEVLSPYADHYFSIQNQELSFVNPENEHEAHKIIRSLHRINNDDWKPILIYLISKFKDDNEKFYEHLWRLERLAYYLLLTRRYASTRIARYSKVLDAIDADIDIEDSEHPLNLSSENYEDYYLLEALDGPIYQHTAACRPTLLRLDEERNSGSASYKYKVLTIEHVYPQTVSDGSFWANTFDNHENEKMWTHALANLVLLNKKKNSRASNWGFSKKKKEYFKQGDTSPFALTTEVIGAEEWTEESLLNRQRGILECFREIWDIETEIDDLESYS